MISLGPPGESKIVFPPHSPNLYPHSPSARSGKGIRCGHLGGRAGGIILSDLPTTGQFPQPEPMNVWAGKVMGRKDRLIEWHIDYLLPMLP